METLPRAESGKLLKRLVKTQYWEGGMGVAHREPYEGRVTLERRRYRFTEKTRSRNRPRSQSRVEQVVVLGLPPFSVLEQVHPAPSA